MHEATAGDVGAVARGYALTASPITVAIGPAGARRGGGVALSSADAAGLI